MASARGYIIFLLVIYGVAAQPLSRTLSFNSITTPWNNPISLDYHEPSDTVMASINFGSGGPNFARIDSTGTLYQYTNLSDIVGELNMAIVPPNTPGGFQSGDVYGGYNNQYCTVLQIRGGVANTQWCVLPSSICSNVHFGFGSFKVDTTGVWNYNLIAVTQHGDVYQIPPTCTGATKLWTVNNGAGDWCEGVIVIPNNTTVWGPLAGDVAVACETQNLYTFDHTTRAETTHYSTGCASDDMDLIPYQQNWFGMNWSNGKYIGTPASEWAGLEGYILHTTHNTGLQVMWYNFQTGKPAFTLLQTDPNGPYQPSDLWEQSSFTPSGISEVLPVGFCMKLNASVGSTLQTSWNITAIPLSTATALGNYKYSITTPYSSACTTPAPVSGAVNMFFTQDAQNTFGFSIIIDSPSNTLGGTLSMTLSSTNLGSPSPVIQDDPSSLPSGSGDFADNLLWLNNQGNFQWQWGPGRTDGIVLSPLSFVSPPNNKAFTMTFSVSAHSAAINSWRFYYPNPSGGLAYYNLDLTQSFTLARVSCTCGNGIVEAFEDCDGGACCTADCHFQPSTLQCRASSGQVCDVATYCTGNSGACPADPYQPSTVLCRPSAGPCDIPDYCPGNGPACSADAKQPTTTVCRPSQFACDAVEYCDGSNNTCPPDVDLPNGTPCDDHNPCTNTSYCDQGQCTGIYTNCPPCINGNCSSSNDYCLNSTTGLPIHEGDPCLNSNPCTLNSTCHNGSCVGTDVLCAGVCGDGILAQAEECDWGIPNSDCCSKFCLFLPNGTLCRNSTARCDPPGFCDGSSAICPADTPGICPTCPGNCSNHGVCYYNGCICDTGYSGATCNIVDCSAFTDCSSCIDPACGWCCDTQTCMAGNATASAGVCNTYQYHQCVCPECQNGGSCVCGNCSCLPGFGGSDCSLIIGCDGNLYAANDTNIPKADVCNVCNGTGTTCIGCDGIPFGKSYDTCGICGGDGSTCYAVCSAHTTCSDCVGTEGCVWCNLYNGTGFCEQNGYKFLYSCPDWKSSCSFLDDLTPLEKGLSLGAIVAIAIGGAVALGVFVFGGKKGYDLYKKYKFPQDQLKNNPLYKDPGTSGVSPFYQEPSSAVELTDK